MVPEIRRSEDVHSARIVPVLEYFPLQKFIHKFTVLYFCDDTGDFADCFTRLMRLDAFLDKVVERMVEIFEWNYKQAFVLWFVHFARCSAPEQEIENTKVT